MADEIHNAFPRDNLVRAVQADGVEFRAAGESDTPNDGRLGTLVGRFTPLGDWTEINSMFEGNFMERFASGALKKTVAENRDGMRVLFQHGRDPQVGDKPLGPIEELGADARYQVKLLDTAYNRDLLPGLKEGLYGASFRFAVVKEEWDDQPAASDYNPKALPERTVTEARVMEFGPVTFPAYSGASASVRSLTDEFMAPRAAVERLEPPKEELKEPEHSPEEPESRATPEDKQEPDHSELSSRATPQPANDDQQETTMNEYRSVEEIDARLAEITDNLNEISKEHGVRALEADAKATWDDLVDERGRLETDKTDYLARQAYLGEMGARPENREVGAGSRVAAAARNKAPENIYDLTEYHQRATSQEHMGRLLEEGAKRAIDGFTYPNPSVNREDTSEKVERLLAQDGPDREIAQRLLTHGSPTYRSAFWKKLSGQPLSSDEQRAMEQGIALESRALNVAAVGGVTVPVQIDPTVLLSSSGAINPFRQVAKLVQTTSYQWQGVTSAGITAQFRAEAAAMTDNSPTLVAPTINPERADAFVPFSWESAADWGALESDMASMFADAKDVLEATKFASGAGHGSNEPLGVLTGAGTVVGTNATTVVGTVDIYALEQSLPVRFQPNAVWLATPALFSRIRQLAPGAQYGIWADSLQVGQPARLLGYPAYKASTVGTAGGNAVNVASTKWGIFGDFSKFAIVDRIGMQVKYIENLFNGNTAGGIAYPNGQSGVVLYWRTSSGVLASNAFRTGTTT